MKADLAFPCATQNELNADDAKQLADNGASVVVEGANMPVTAGGVEALRNGGVIFAPAKAANAGGVAVSGLEQSQNSLRVAWSHEEVDSRLKVIMADIHDKCLRHGDEINGVPDYLKGANVAGFIKVADAMLAYGAV